MASGEFSPGRVLDGVLSHLNRDQTEMAAQRIALERNIASESLEIFPSLASQLAKQGVSMGEAHNDGLYTNWAVFKPKPAEVDQVQRQLEAHRQGRSPEFRAAVEDNLTVQSALRTLFPDEYQNMLDERDTGQDTASDILLSGTQNIDDLKKARNELERLGTLEVDWYGRKLQDALATKTLHE